MSTSLQLNFVLLYVANPVESAAFYTRILGCKPVDASPTFALFALDSGLKLGLWARHTVAPTPLGAAPCADGELAFALPDVAAVNATHAAWLALGLPMLQQPTAMDFGFTFTATDPDGHRLRVFTPQGD